VDRITWVSTEWDTELLALCVPCDFRRNLGLDI